ncbi:Clathrin/coatomer adaptor, adaptin-like protein [Gaertneriomyces semiglobifer]|nr:Clathrin/coatomer adaptor, adaptin-like protein [Gaertneriomyces semiglobifer]
MISKGRNVKEFFPDVVKLVAASSLEVRKLVYIYLLRYAEEEPDLALLSINTFQKDLTDRNPLIRAMAVRVLSSIRVQVIVPIIMLSLKKALTDLSPYVRKAAANALPKIYSLDPAQLPYLIELIEGLLNDKSTLVLGSAVTSMMEICPERLDLIHKHYRKLCRVLVDANEWEQIAIMTLLGKYVRLFFDRPDDVEDTQALQVMDSHQHSLFSSESNSEFEIKHVQESIKNSQPRNSLDPDHELFLIACEPLLNSRNTSVVLTAIQIFYHQAPRSYLSRGIRALMRLLRTSKEERYITLRTISTIASRCPQAFEPYLKHFFVFEGEPKFISDMKLELLCTVATEERAKEIVREFKEYVHSPDKHMVIRSVQVLGRLCSKIPMVTEEVLSLLMTSISHRDEEILSQTILTLLTLLHQHPASMTPIALRRLARALNHVTTPRARAAVVWLIGEYHHITTTTAVDVLRILAKGFADEADVVRAAIVGLAVKLAVAKDINENARDRCNLLVDYVFELARWDPTWDVRDRTRLLQSMVPLKSKPVSLVDVAENAESGTGEAPPRDVETSLRRHARDILLSRKSTFTSSRTADGT